MKPTFAHRLADHDASLYTENAFEVFIDPNGDRKNYCELEYNALNTTMDLLMDKPYRDRGRPDLSFELEGMKTAVHIDGTLNDSKDTDRGWDIEIAIPFASLKSITKVDHPKDGDQWRVNFAAGGVPRAGKARVVGLVTARPHGYAHAGTVRVRSMFCESEVIV